MDSDSSVEQSPQRPPRRRRGRTSLLARGEPMLWLTGGGLALSVVMILGLLTLVVWFGVSTFWPRSLVQVTTHDGKTYLGEPFRDENFEPDETLQARISGAAKAALDTELAADEDGEAHRVLLRTGNFDLTRTHFTWVSDYEIAEQSEPAWAVLLERETRGRFYGFPQAFVIDGEVVAEGPEAAWQRFEQEHALSRERWEQAYHLKEHGLGAIRRREEAARLAIQAAVLEDGEDSPAVREAEQAAVELSAALAAERTEIEAQIAALEDENARYQLRMRSVDGADVDEVVAGIVRAVPANSLGTADKWGVYFSRWGEFLTADPREANAEGGVLPAIFGTVIMTLIMTIVVVPFGVLAALYLREYAKAGPLVSVIRIAINNLAGVPSIVFGVFGLGFFCYELGGWIDGGPEQAMSIRPWIGISIAMVIAVVVAVLAMLHRNRQTARRDGNHGIDVLSVILGIASWSLLTLVVVVALWQRVGVICLLIPVLGLGWMLRTHLKRRGDPIASRVPVWLDWAAPLSWLSMVGLLITVVWFNPFFDGFYSEKLPNPTFGSGGIMWAALTLALLTLPVVIVSTEEALSAVPRSMREGSFACGASKWQTIQRIVLPRALPGIMTGSILAMARGAGEVAPLMLVGAVKLAPELPFEDPFTGANWDGFLGFLPIYPERSFMHLGFHIFDLGFQSQNSEAARPMVYTTTLLLISIVVMLNLAAIYLRSRLRRRFGGSQF